MSARDYKKPGDYARYVRICKRCHLDFQSFNRNLSKCRKCSESLKKKKRHAYSKSFDNAAPFIRIRDKSTCQWCGRCMTNRPADQPNPPVHHIDGDHKNDDTKNLVTLCESCHLRVHKKNCFRHFSVERITIPSDPPLPKKRKKNLFRNSHL